MIRIFTHTIEILTPPAVTAGALFGWSIAQSSQALNDNSAITIGLASGAMMTVGAICLWVGRKTGAYDQRLKDGDKRLDDLERSVRELRCRNGVPEQDFHPAGRKK